MAGEGLPSLRRGDAQGGGLTSERIRGCLVFPMLKVGKMMLD